MNADQGTFLMQLCQFGLGRIAILQARHPGSDIAIGSFDVSPDSRQILFAKVQQNSDVVLIDLTGK